MSGGHLKPLRLLKQTGPGLCPDCAVKHEPGLPHDLQSFAYQYRFNDLHGRLPTWSDAMSHCTEDVMAAWIAALAKRGINVGEGE